eukprot:m.394786 g.394786  ORF g.394786 m.394786 type:complete len:1389 (-) comp28346_c0_seq20:85-4251(-)
MMQDRTVTMPRVTMRSMCARLCGSEKTKRDRRLYDAVKAGNAALIDAGLCDGGDPTTPVGRHGVTAVDRAYLMMQDFTTWHIDGVITPELANLKHLAQQRLDRELYAAVETGNTDRVGAMLGGGADPTASIGTAGAPATAAALAAVRVAEFTWRRIDAMIWLSSTVDVNSTVTSLPEEPSVDIGPTTDQAPSAVEPTLTETKMTHQIERALAHAHARVSLEMGLLRTGTVDPSVQQGAKDVSLQHRPGEQLGLLIKATHEFHRPNPSDPAKPIGSGRVYVVISKMTAGGLADQSGQIKVGDRLLKINGAAIDDCGPNNYRAAMSMIKGVLKGRNAIVLTVLGDGNDRPIVAAHSADIGSPPSVSPPVMSPLEPTEMNPEAVPPPHVRVGSSHSTLSYDQQAPEWLINGSEQQSGDSDAHPDTEAKRRRPSAQFEGIAANPLKMDRRTQGGTVVCRRNPMDVAHEDAAPPVEEYDTNIGLNAPATTPSQAHSADADINADAKWRSPGVLIGEIAVCGSDGRGTPDEFVATPSRVAVTASPTSTEKKKKHRRRKLPQIPGSTESSPLPGTRDSSNDATLALTPMQNPMDTAPKPSGIVVPGNHMDAAIEDTPLEGESSGTVARITAQVAREAVEFDAQLQYYSTHSRLPTSVLAVAAEQLLDAIGVVVVTVSRLLVHAERDMTATTPLSESLIKKLKTELPKLAEAVATFEQWQLAVPTELQALTAVEVDRLVRILPLTPADPTLVNGGGGSGVGTLQRILGALVIAGGETAVRHLSWVRFDAKGEALFETAEVAQSKTKVRVVVHRPSEIPPECAVIDKVLEIFREREAVVATTVTPIMVGDIAAYTAARDEAVATAPPTITTTIELLCTNSVQRRRTGGTTPSMPPPNTLADVVQMQIRATKGLRSLCEMVSAAVAASRADVAVLPREVEPLGHTVFKSAVGYRCKLTRTRTRCSVAVGTLTELLAVLEALLGTPDLAVASVSTYFDGKWHRYGGCLALLGVGVESEGGWIDGEIRLFLRSTLAITEAAGRGRVLYDYAKSLPAVLDASKRLSYKGSYTAAIRERMATGLLLKAELVNLDDPDHRGAWAGMRGLAATLRVSTCQLAVLDLSNTQIGNGGAAALADGFTVNIFLRTLILSGNRIGELGAAALAVGLEANTSLTAISLRGNCFGDVGAVALAKSLNVNRALRTICLARTRMGTVGIMAMAEMLRANAVLIAIHFGGNPKIGDAGAAAVAQALTVNRTLRILILAQTQIEDAGAVALAKALKLNTVLCSIDLSDNAVKNTGLAAFRDALKVNTTIAQINLTSNAIDAVRTIGRIDIAGNPGVEKVRRAKEAKVKAAKEKAKAEKEAIRMAKCREENDRLVEMYNEAQNDWVHERSCSSWSF